MRLGEADDARRRGREGDRQGDEDRREPEKLLMRDAERLERGFADQAGNEGAEQELGQPRLMGATHGGKAAEAGPAGERENRRDAVRHGIHPSSLVTDRLTAPSLFRFHPATHSPIHA